MSSAPVRSVIFALASSDRRVWSPDGVFATAYTVLISIGYFPQLT
jgi:hypothetical protein